MLLSDVVSKTTRLADAYISELRRIIMTKRTSLVDAAPQKQPHSFVKFAFREVATFHSGTLKRQEAEYRSPIAQKDLATYSAH